MQNLKGRNEDFSLMRNEKLREPFCLGLLNLSLKNELDFVSRIKEWSFGERSRNFWNVQRAKAGKNRVSL